MTGDPQNHQPQTEYTDENIQHPDLTQLPYQPMTYDFQQPPTVGDVIGALWAGTRSIRVSPADATLLWALKDSDQALPDPLNMPQCRRFFATLAPELSDQGVRTFRDQAITLMLGWTSRSTTPTTFTCPPNSTESQP